MSTAPTLNGQVIGQAHYATRALLETVLAPTGTTFNQSVALNAVAGGGEAVEQSALVARMTGTLKIDESAVLATIGELAESRLLETLPGDTSRLRLTEAGRALNGRIRAAVAEITERLYGGMPAEDLQTAGRLLTLVTARANAALADA
ncbi:MarR family winged helix-turn-helix transcriptional regulator [Streptomyces sp. NPDC019890]|uniref:MarR family winged helix-turn-helix transcriptional regulator n=1 Tax=Streptomyces sp. NPDC019890 TaxID=3365064 RepID=UPI00384BAC16